jgi:hypothetical protein
MKTQIAFVLAASLLAAACDSDEPSTTPARFAALSHAERQAAITAALGFPLLLGELTVNSMETARAAEACLARHEIEQTIVLDAGIGCTTDSGVSYSGRVRVVADPAWTTLLQFDDLRVEAGNHLAFSGTVGRSAPDARGETRTVEDLTFDADVPVDVSIEAVCDAGGTCVADANAHGTLPGAGDFTVAFSRRLVNGEWSGWIELRGADVLRMELVTREEGCWTYTIDGAAAGTWCGASR